MLWFIVLSPFIWFSYSIHYEYDWQRKRTKYTVPQVDKGTSLHCFYVKMCRTGVTCIFTFLHNSSEGMFLCLPEELYILSAFFVCHVHSDNIIHIVLINFQNTGKAYMNKKKFLYRILLYNNGERKWTCLDIRLKQILLTTVSIQAKAWLWHWLNSNYLSFGLLNYYHIVGYRHYNTLLNLLYWYILVFSLRLPECQSLAIILNTTAHY